MPKTKKVYASLKEVLEEFDDKILMTWLKKNKPMTYEAFKSFSKEVRTTNMCIMIINRTDMLGTEAYLKAVRYLTVHASDGRKF